MENGPERINNFALLCNARFFLSFKSFVCMLSEDVSQWKLISAEEHVTVRLRPLSCSLMVLLIANRDKRQGENLRFDVTYRLSAELQNLFNKK